MSVGLRSPRQELEGGTGGEPFAGAEECRWVQRRDRVSLQPPVLVHLLFHCQPGQRVLSTQCPHGGIPSPADRGSRLWTSCSQAKLPELDAVGFFKVHLETPTFGLKKERVSPP